MIWQGIVLPFQSLHTASVSTVGILILQKVEVNDNAVELSLVRNPCQSVLPTLEGALYLVKSHKQHKYKDRADYGSERY